MQPMWNKKDILPILGLALTYWASARLGHYIYNFGPISLVWPPTGISLFALIVFGYRLWPGIAIGATLTALSSGDSAIVAIGATASSTLEALFGAWMLNRTGFDRKLDHPRDVWLIDRKSVV